MAEKISFKETVVIGLMLFALFFGAGNLIFPPSLGQAAGSHLWSAIIGFLVTGVGLPLLGVLAIGFSGQGNVQSLAGRVHPVFGIVFPVIMYLTIGPLFAIPRTATVAYETGMLPFLPQEVGGSSAGLFVYTLVYFVIVYFIALNPTKIADNVGKILTPVLLIFLFLLLLKNVVTPMGMIQEPVEPYTHLPFFKGFQEGYLTMDTIAALVFGIIVINAIKAKGVQTRKDIAKACTKATLIASAGLASIYIGLAYLGATSVEQIGHAENGGIILSLAANYHFGFLGNIVLGIIITLACLTTSIGLVAACASFFAELISSVSYKVWVFLMTIASAIIANIGLTQLIALSVPVLVAIYPLVIVLIILTFLHPLFKGRAEVYRYSLFFTGLISIVDGLNAANIRIDLVHNLVGTLPFFNIGLGWLVPAAIGAVIGYLSAFLRSQQ